LKRYNGKVKLTIELDREDDGRWIAEAIELPADRIAHGEMSSSALAILERIGWRIQRQRGSHRLLVRQGWPDYEFSFHDHDEIGRLKIFEAILG
jgi:predicted RNA binding protein YcfA (HicA-like mRNA interferase family)